MKSPELHEGWTNYETWLVAAWLDNDRKSAERTQQAAETCRTAAPGLTQVTERIWTVEQATQFLLADALKVTYVTHYHAPIIGMYADLLDQALGRVNWNEIAADLLETV
jgi:hypothetical protein